MCGSKGRLLKQYVLALDKAYMQFSLQDSISTLCSDSLQHMSLAFPEQGQGLQEVKSNSLLVR